MDSWNWRDEFEEKTIMGDRVLIVIQDGNRFIGLARDSDGYVFSVESSLIRKPRPKTYRPWTRDEVPVGKVVKHKESGIRYVISCAAYDKSYLPSTGWENNKCILNDYTLEDGSPCGVEVQS